MEIPIYQIDAFADRVFAGNPAAVCPLEEWLPDDTLQDIAAENNLSETAFFLPQGEEYPLRWFTPALEVDLCGHATLAAGAVVFLLQPDRKAVKFSSRSGPLWVKRQDDLLALDFPSSPPDLCMAPEELLAGLDCDMPLQVSRDRRYYLVEVRSEAIVRALEPNLDEFMQLDRLGVIVTAKGDDVDFVSRFFAPKAGIGEDPVTGSAHCVLTPYWAQKLGKTTLHARQLSARGGELFCEHMGRRVLIGGYAVPYLEGRIRI